MSVYADWPDVAEPSNLFQPVPATRAYETIETIFWPVGHKGSGWWTRVEPGRVFDVSAPDGLEWLVRIIAGKHYDALLIASAVHDEILRQGWSWRPAAGVFGDVVEHYGMPRWRVRILYAAVAHFGR